MSRGYVIAFTYVDTKVEFRNSDDDLSDLGRLVADRTRRAMAGYSHPTVEARNSFCRRCLPFMSRALYDDLERSGWTTMNARATPGLAFSIIVDGEHFIPYRRFEHACANRIPPC
jgi:hypothetical protein